MDLSTIDSAEKLFNQIQQRELSVDILINNAGFGLNGKFTDSDIEKDTKMIILNVLTLTKLTKLFTNEFLKQSGKKHIINIASTAAFQAVPFMAVYSATKSYVLNFSEALAYELKDTNVKITTICPGGTQSEFADVAGFKKGKFGTGLPTSQDLAEFIYREMKKESVVSIHGLKNKILVFSTSISPRRIIVKIAAKMMQ